MKHTILCIDDEIHNLEALERLLRKDFKVVTAESGPQALELLKENRYSLIISDQKMPEMTGVQFFEKAKTQQPDAIRILLTGYTDLESVIAAINQGQIYRYVTKPWDPEEFKGILSQALDLLEMRQTIAKQNQQLSDANEALKSLDKMKTDFMFLVNHELKTPLTGIFSFVQLLNEESLPKDAQLYLEKITDNTQRLQDLINDTLLITRLQTDAANLPIDEIDVVQEVQQASQKIQDSFVKKNITFHQESSEVTYRGPKTYFTTVLTKLFHNCGMYSKEGSTVEIQINNNDEFIE
ncbi:MAG: hybrid sensor histidine kinase/response regulator, partial [Pseudomonadota bacterium]